MDKKYFDYSRFYYHKSHDYNSAYQQSTDYNTNFT